MTAIAILSLLVVGAIFLAQRQLLGLVMGVLLIGNGINLYIFLGSEPAPGAATFVSAIPTATELNDPVPQALVLTAIVIGLALLVFMVALVKKLVSVFSVYDASDMIREDRYE